MLALSRRIGEQIVIDGVISVTVAVIRETECASESVRGSSFNLNLTGK